MDQNKLNVAIVGTGFGAIVHLPAFIHNPHYHVVGIYGRNYTKTAAIAKEHGIQAYRSLEEIEEDVSVDMVSISSIVCEHFEMAERFMKSKKNILLEKPMALNATQTERLAHLAKQYGNYTAVGHEHTYDSSWQFLRQIVRDKCYGAIRSMQFEYSFAYWNNVDSKRKFDWFSQKEFGGGLKGGHFSHILRIVDFISEGQIKSINGQCFVEVPGHYDSEGKLQIQTAEDTVTATIMVGENVPVHVNISAARNETFKKVLINMEKAQIIISGQNDLKICNWKNELYQDRIDSKYLIVDYQEDFRINSFVKLLDDFYETYYEGKTENDIVDFAKGHELQNLLDQVI